MIILALTIVCSMKIEAIILRLIVKVYLNKEKSLIQILKPRNCAETLKSYTDNAMFLNRGNKVLAIYQMSTGGISGTVGDPRLLFIAALKVGAVATILAHNHPLNYKTLSSADKELTEKIKDGGKLLEIKLLDHLIITADEGYTSMAGHGVT